MKQKLGNGQSYFIHRKMRAMRERFWNRTTETNIFDVQFCGFKLCVACIRSCRISICYRRKEITEKIKTSPEMETKNNRREKVIHIGNDRNTCDRNTFNNLKFHFDR